MCPDMTKQLTSAWKAVPLKSCEVVPSRHYCYDYLSGHIHSLRSCMYPVSEVLPSRQMLYASTHEVGCVIIARG